MEEFRKIQERVKLAKQRDKFVIVNSLAARTVDLTQALLDEQPTVLHFSGHGSLSGAICLQSDAGETKLVEATALGTLLSLFTETLRCVVLNACYSAGQADAIVAHIDHVVAMPNAISDESAIAYSVGFYSALGAGRSIEDAHRFGIAQIAVEGLSAPDPPLLLSRTAVGTPAFIETPTVATQDHLDYSDLTLLMTEEAGLMLVHAAEIENAEAIALNIVPDNDAETAYLSRLSVGDLVSAAFGSTAVVVTLDQISQRRANGIETWRLVGTPNRGPYTPPLGEMSALGYSADKLAEMRGRRILLDERLAVPQGPGTAELANQTMLEMFVRGFNVPLQVTHSPLPGLYKELRDRPALFIAAAKLISTMWLRLSGVVALIDELTLELTNSILSVRFRGRRFRAYTNADATVLEVVGSCELNRDAVKVTPPIKVHDVMFDGERRFDLTRGGVFFTGEADGKRILCFISEAALQDYFQAGTKTDSALQAFDVNVAEIHRIAIDLLKNGRLDDERRLFIRSADVSALRRGDC
jgi:Protein of unknown function (DUF1488)/CHAT domain